MAQKLGLNLVRILVCLLVIGVGSVPIVCRLVVHLSLMPQLNERNADLKKHYDSIIKDLQQVSQNPPFSGNERTKNAEPLLSQYISWEGEGINPVSLKDLEILRTLSQQYDGWRFDDQKLRLFMSDARLAEIDTSWMDQLHEYDHLDLTSRAEFKNQLDSAATLNGVGRIGIFSTLPMPSHLELRDWATIYFFKKYQEGQSLEGLKLYRKVAQLGHSEGALVGNMLAYGMLKDEHQFVNALEISEWPLISKELIEAYKRVSWVWVGLVRTPWFDGQLPAEFEPYLTRQTGVCASVWETAIGVSGVQDFLEPQFPLEMDFSERMENARQFQNRLLELCNMDSYKGLVAKTPVEANPWMLQGETNFSRIPYLRRIRGLNLMLASTPHPVNYLRYYDQGS